MEKDKRGKGKGQGKGGRSTNQRKRRSVQDWHNLYKVAIENLEEDQKSMIETYRQAALTGIGKITRGTDLEELENWENVKESYAYEIITPRIPHYLKEEFTIAQTVRLAKKLASKRQGSWKMALIRQREAIQVHPDRFIIERDDEGEIQDVAPLDLDWAPPLLPLDASKADPEAYLLRLEELEMVRNLPVMVGQYPTKHASLYQRILEIQLSGEDVGPEHCEILGVEKAKQLREFKSQAFALAAWIMAEIFPDLKEKQVTYTKQRAKKWKVKRSKFEQRCKLYRDPYKDEIKPSPVRHLRVIKGALTKPHQISGSALPHSLDLEVIEAA